MKFKDSYGKVVKDGDTILIESTYNSSWPEGSKATVYWSDHVGMFRWEAKRGGMELTDDFYRIHKFKKIKP